MYFRGDSAAAPFVPYKSHHWSGDSAYKPTRPCQKEMKISYLARSLAGSVRTSRFLDHLMNLNIKLRKLLKDINEKILKCYIGDSNSM